MAAVVRVKRRIDENPADSLVISCKRLKKSTEGTIEHGRDADELKSLFKFAATVPEQEGSIVSHIREAIRKEKLQREYKHHNVPVDISSRARRQHLLAARRSRYQVVAHKRAFQLEGLDAAEAQNSHNERQVALNALQRQNRPDPRLQESASNKRKDVDEEQERESKRLFCLYDVVTDGEKSNDKDSGGACASSDSFSRNLDPAPETITCNAVPMVRQRVPTQYVYDLYYMNNPDFDFRALEHVLAIEARDEAELVPDEAEPDEYYEDEDDSNDEDNWRNDYPDEDPRFYDHDGADSASYGDAEYFDGREDEDVDGLSYMVDRNLGFDESGAEESGSEEESPGVLADDWRPSRSYEDHMKKLMKDFQQHNNSDADG